MSPPDEKSSMSLWKYLVNTRTDRLVVHHLNRPLSIGRSHLPGDLILHHRGSRCCLLNLPRLRRSLSRFTLAGRGLALLPLTSPQFFHLLQFSNSFCKSCSTHLLSMNPLFIVRSDSNQNNFTFGQSKPPSIPGIPVARHSIAIVVYISKGIPISRRTCAKVRN